MRNVIALVLAGCARARAAAGHVIRPATARHRSARRCTAGAAGRRRRIHRRAGAAQQARRRSSITITANDARRVVHARRARLRAVAAASCGAGRSRARARMVHRVELDAAIAPLLAKPIDRDSRGARSRSRTTRGCARELAELGIAGGELASALGLGPLDVDCELRFGIGRPAYEFEVEVIQNVLGLITAPRLRAAARADLAAAQATRDGDRARASSHASRSRFTICSPRSKRSSCGSTAFDAADAAALVRERMHAAGNTTDLAQARDRDAREQARVDLARAEADVEIAREAAQRAARTVRRSDEVDARRHARRAARTRARARRSRARRRRREPRSRRRARRASRRRRIGSVPSACARCCPTSASARRSSITARASKSGPLCGSAFRCSISAAANAHAPRRASRAPSTS